MSLKIQSGSGNSKEATVDNTFRILNRGIVQSTKEFASLASQRYNAVSGIVTLTSGNESGLFYFKNNENYDFVITNVFAHFGSSTGGTGAGILRVYINPTTGTLISGASAATSSNFFVGSANVLSATLYKGVEGSTITSGTTGITQYFNPALYNEKNIAVDGLVIPKGAAMAISITPPASNTSLGVNVGIGGYLNNPSVSGL